MHSKVKKSELNKLSLAHNQNRYKDVMENFSKYSHQNEIVNRNIKSQMEDINGKTNLIKNKNALAKSTEKIKLINNNNISNNNISTNLFTNSDLIIQAREFAKIREARQNSKGKKENKIDLNFLNRNENQNILTKINKRNIFENKFKNLRTDNSTINTYNKANNKKTQNEK